VWVSRVGLRVGVGRVGSELGSGRVWVRIRYRVRVWVGAGVRVRVWVGDGVRVIGLGSHRRSARRCRMAPPLLGPCHTWG